jgi:aspartate/methionine/tyrosine aminotransferase
MKAIAGMLEPDVAPNRLPDSRWLQASLREGREPILLGLGERWGGTPEPLVRALATAPDSAHGYQLSMYGLPRLRAVLAQYLRQSHRLHDVAGAYETAVSWTGTRLVMRDFAELVLAQRPDLAGACAVAVGPAWDYAGVFEPLGFRLSYLVPSGGQWAPTAESVASFAATRRRRIGLVVINAQHNPTGLSWDAAAVRALLRLAAVNRAAVLVDDAYYGFADPADNPTSALRELLSLPEAADLPWCAVRSLGKQFNCNGWGIGAVVARPDLLDELVNAYRAEHTYNSGGVLQHAMAEWLADTAAVRAYLAAERDFYAASRGAAIVGLVGHGIAPADIVAGPAAPYLLYPVPPGWPSRGAYLQSCGLEAGVLMSDAWPSVRPLGPQDGRHIRMYLGREPEVLAEACRRLGQAGLLTGRSG